MDTAKISRSKSDDILETAKNRFALCEEFEQKIREDAKDDLKFRKGDQWPADIKAMRLQDNRPSLTINKMPQFTRQIINDQKQNRPAIKVSPIDDNADIETAKVLQGVIRNIENQSDADYAYDKAFECAVNGSFGYWRILTKYVDDKSFDQEVRIELVDDPFKVMLDKDSRRPDGSDAKYGFIWDTMSKDEFKRTYSESKLAQHSDWDFMAESSGGLCTSDEVTVCEYFYIDEKKAKLIELSDGNTYFADELPEQEENGLYYLNGDSFEVVNERWSKKCVVKWCKLNGVEILEETEFPGSYIPIIPVYGDVLNIDGEMIRESVIRHSKDSQRMVNYMASAEAEAIALAPKAPFIGAEGQFEDHEGEWRSANVKNYPYLEYKPISVSGNLLGPPQRNAFEPAVGAITNSRLQANQDVKETTGIPDATRGLASPESSGIAIQRRVHQGLTSNFHFVDNLSKSIRHTGRILVEIIPIVYDGERVIRALGMDDTEQMIRVNSMMLLKGQQRTYDFSYGKYDVSVATGPSFETKRQEARDSMLAMSQSNPKFAEVAGDLMVKNMDWPGSDEIAERLKRTLPPEIAGANENAEELPPQARAMMAQMQQTIQSLSAKLEQQKEIIDKDILQLESKERIEMMKAEKEYKLELIKIDGKNANMLLNEEIKQINERQEALGINEPLREQFDVSLSGEMERPNGQNLNFDVEI